MIGSYAIPRWQMLIASLLVRTPWKLLPNIVAGKEIVPEFVPYVASKGAAPMVDEALPLLAKPEKLESMSRRLADMRALFGEADPGKEGAQRILSLLESWREDPQTIPDS